ncbi:MAG: hypothetical protein NTW19_05935 [Planctomycetota bacterium]|nr:hypothetical protein [Planctomycetota bacterium]
MTQQRLALCPTCERRFRWDPRFAGKKILCPCTTKFRMPTKAPVEATVGVLVTPPTAAQKPAEAEEDLPVLTEEAPEEAAAESVAEAEPAPPADDEAIVDLVPTRKEVIAPAPARETYDVDEEAAAPPPVPPAPRVPPTAPAVSEEIVEEALGEEVAEDDDAGEAAPPPSPPMPSMLVGPKSAVERALAERTEEYQPSPIWEYVVPGAMVALGILFTLGVWAMWLGHTALSGLGAGGILVGMNLLLYLPIAIGAALFTARAMDVGFGAFPPLVLKLAGVSLLCGSMADSVGFWVFHYGEFDWTYLVAAFAPYAFALGPPLMLLFQLEFKEAFMMVAIMAIPRLGLVVGLVALAPSLFKMPEG